MAKIKIDNKDYDTDALSDEAKAQLVSLQFCDNELRELQAKVMAIQKARERYVAALNVALDELSIQSSSIAGTSQIASSIDALDAGSVSVVGDKKKKGLFGGFFGKK